MRLVTFESPNGPRLGVLAGGEDATELFDLAMVDGRLPNDMMSLLSMGKIALADLAAAIVRPPAAATRSLAETTLHAPVPRPSKIIGIGLNYQQHVDEAGRATPEYITAFAKFPSSVCGPEDAIVYPAACTRLDYEGELGVVIGERCRNVPVSAARTVIAGYLNVNDISARDWQSRTSQWTLGKSFDTFTPIGPTLVSADEVPDPQHMDLVVRVNGEVRQDSNTSEMIFSIDQLISELSSVCTLLPGDIIATGTPAGVGISFTPERLLGVGDEVAVHVAGLGILRNTVAAAPQATEQTGL